MRRMNAYVMYRGGAGSPFLRIESVGSVCFFQPEFQNPCRRGVYYHGCGFPTKSHVGPRPFWRTPKPAMGLQSPISQQFAPAPGDSLQELFMLAYECVPRYGADGSWYKITCPVGGGCDHLNPLSTVPGSTSCMCSVCSLAVTLLTNSLRQGQLFVACRCSEIVRCARSIVCERSLCRVVC